MDQTIQLEEFKKVMNYYLIMYSKKNLTDNEWKVYWGLCKDYTKVDLVTFFTERIEEGDKKYFPAPWEIQNQMSRIAVRRRELQAANQFVIEEQKGESGGVSDEMTEKHLERFCSHIGAKSMEEVVEYIRKCWRLGFSEEDTLKWLERENMKVMKGYKKNEQYAVEWLHEKHSSAR